MFPVVARSSVSSRMSDGEVNRYCSRSAFAISRTSFTHPLRLFLGSGYLFSPTRNALRLTCPSLPQRFELPFRVILFGKRGIERQGRRQLGARLLRPPFR